MLDAWKTWKMVCLIFWIWWHSEKQAAPDNKNNPIEKTLTQFCKSIMPENIEAKNRWWSCEKVPAQSNGSDDCQTAGGTNSVWQVKNNPIEKTLTQFCKSIMPENIEAKNRWWSCKKVPAQSNGSDEFHTKGGTKTGSSGRPRTIQFEKL
jgi:DNA polymerase sigma